MIQINLVPGKEQRRIRREQKCGQGCDGVGGMNWEFRFDIYILLLLLSRFSCVRLCETP